MRTIDIHAHATPQSFIKAATSGEEWHTLTLGSALSNPRNGWTPEQRIADMNSLGVDIQVVSTTAAFYRYDLDAEVTAAMHRECNDEVSQLTKDHPDRFAGLANLPMQDPTAAIAELERSMVDLGLKGAMINDTANNVTYDEPQYLPFWKAAKELGR